MAIKLGFRTPVAMESSLPLDECIQRLQAITVSQYAFWKPRKSFPLAGKVLGVSATMRYRTFYNNSFQRRLRLVLQPTGTGTMLSGGWAMSPAVLIFAAYWLIVVCGLGAVFGGGLLTGKMHLEHNAHDFMYLLPAGLVLFAVAVVAFGLWLSGRTELKLMEIVQQALGARVIPAPPQQRG